MTKTIDDMLKELSEWLSQPAFANILNEDRKEELRVIMHKYFTSKAHDMDILLESFEEGVHELVKLKSENINLTEEKKLLGYGMRTIREENEFLRDFLDWDDKEVRTYREYCWKKTFFDESEDKELKAQLASLEK